MLIHGYLACTHMTHGVMQVNRCPDWIRDEEPGEKQILMRRSILSSIPIPETLHDTPLPIPYGNGTKPMLLYPKGPHKFPLWFS